MCEGIKICCVFCQKIVCAYKNSNNKFINYNLLRCCENFQTCYKQHFRSINVICDYKGICNLCQREIKEMKNKIMSDIEFRIYLDKINVNVLKIDHYFDADKERACVSCDYVVPRCWLCDQCKSCCEWNVRQLV
jgi:hypothetical protein